MGIAECYSTQTCQMNIAVPGCIKQGMPRRWGLSCVHRHPLNVEPTPTALMKYGFITPASLHYVRNHGPVPKIKWSQHKLEINGLVERPTTFTMDQLLSTFEHIDVLCTLTCAGNRRKVRSQSTSFAV